MGEYLTIGWLMVSWWPHDNLHIHNGMDMQGLLYIEYGFLSLVRQKSDVTAPQPARVG